MIIEDYSFHLIGQYADSEIGHHLGYLLDTKRALELLKAKVRIYVPRQANATIPDSCERWFHPFSIGNRFRFFNDCKQLFKPKQSNRIFVMESFSRRDLRLFAASAFFFSRPKDLIWLVLRDDLTSRHAKDQSSIHLSLRALSFRFKQRLVLLSDSELLIDYYKKWFLQPIFLLPIFHAPYTPSMFKKKEKIVCSWLGDPRNEKGKEIISKIVKLNDPQAPLFDLIISEGSDLSNEPNQINIRTLKKILSKQEYTDAMLNSDVVLLPYQVHRYKWRTSGIFVEAILAGKIPIVTKGTWMAEQLKAHNLSELIVDWNHQHFFSNLFNLVNDTSIHDKLICMQKAYKQFHSFDSYAQTLAQIFEYTLKESHSNC